MDSFQVFIAVDFSQRAGAATENRALAQTNHAKVWLPVFHTIHQLKLTDCSDFSGTIDKINLFYLFTG